MAPILTRLYRRLGRSYPYLFLTIELQSAFVITAATLGLFSFYYDASTEDYLKILAVSLVLTAAGGVDHPASHLPARAPDQGLAGRLSRRRAARRRPGRRRSACRYP